MADLFGLDFGTTNSLAARVLQAGGRQEVRPYLDRTGAPHPSVVAFHGDRVLLGREAYETLDRAGSGVIGDAVRSPKSFLGTGAVLDVAGVRRRPRDLVAEVIGHVLDASAEQAPEYDFTDAVMTIPVDMDGRARRELREAARDAGLDVHQFVHEPLAALYAYLREGDDLSRTVATLGASPVLVVDWGGGTLDITLCRVSGDSLIQLQNRGEHRVGGDRFDEVLRNMVRQRHAAEHGLKALDVQVGAAARLVSQCERAKKELSDRDDALVFVAGYLAVDGAAADVEVEITREEFERETQPLIDTAMEAVSAVLEQAGVADNHLGLVLLTGGMSRMPLVRRSLERRFGIEKVPAPPNADRLIAHGAAWIAHDGPRLVLAKPFEITLADDHPAELLGAGTPLPVGDEVQPTRFPVHCVDPRDGRARVILTRPVTAGPAQPTDRRVPYSVFTVPVRSDLSPLRERLDLDVVVDSDLVVTVTLHSELTGERQSREIHQLEFGLALEA